MPSARLVGGVDVGEIRVKVNIDRAGNVTPEIGVKAVRVVEPPSDVQ